MLKKIKQLTLMAAKATGLFDVVQKSSWRRERLLIIAYHGISIEDEHLWDPDLFMAPGIFRQRMEMLSERGCTVLPLGEALDRLYAGDLPRNSVALTFDDGFYDFYQQAWPILKEFNFPATLYLTTYHVENNRPVKDAMFSYMLWKARDRRFELKPVIGIEGVFDLSNGDERRRALETLISFVRQEKVSLEGKREISRGIAGQLGIDYDILLEKRILNLLNPTEVRRLAEEGIDIQLHTHRHQTPLNRELFYREITENRNLIEKMTGRRATHFCYPSGIFDEAFFPWLEDLGVVSATTCDPGFSSRESNRMQLPRLVDTMPLSGIEFEGWLTGIAAAMPRRHRTYNIGVLEQEIRPSVSVHN